MKRSSQFPLLVFFLLCSLQAFCQAPAWLWGRAAGGHADVGFDIAVDASGNSVITGFYNSSPISFGSYVLPNSGVNDVFTAKYNNAGTIQWAKKGGSSYNDGGEGVALDDSGNVFTVGWYTANITFETTVLSNVEYEDLFVVKYNSSGVLQWAQKAGSHSDDVATSVTTDHDGNCYVTGYYGNGAQFGAYTLTGTGNDIFIVKYDRDGNIVWLKSFPSPGMERPQSITMSRHNRLYLTGYSTTDFISFGADTFYNSAMGTNDLFIAAFDTAGNSLWAESAGGQADDEAFDIAVDTSDNVYITGSFTSDTIYFAGNPFVNAGTGLTEDIFMAKYDSSGNFTWAKTVGAAGRETGSSVAIDSHGNPLFCGWFYSSSLPFGSCSLYNPTTTFKNDFFIAKYDAAGNNLWAKGTGNSGDDVAYALGLDASNNAYVTGYFNSTSLPMGSFSLYGGGGDCIFNAKLDWQPEALHGTTSVLSTPVCNGYCTGVVSVNPLGGIPPYAYSWSPAGGSTQTISSLCAGIYTCTITDAGSALAMATVTVTQPLPVSANATSYNCPGIAKSAPTGGTPPYSYSWSPSGCTTATCSALSPGSYTVTVTDWRGCTGTGTVTISVSGGLNTTGFPVQDVSCFNGSDAIATVMISGGTAPYTYVWMPSGCTTATCSNVPANNYTVSVTDAQGCTGSSTFVITEPLQLTSNVSTLNNVSCFAGNDGSADVTANGGTAPYWYQWSPAGGTWPTASNLASGIYTVTVTDGNNCATTSTAWISEPSALNANATANNATCWSCADGSAFINENGGSPPYTYIWSPSVSSTASATGLAPGTYTCTVTDSHGCYNIVPVYIGSPAGIDDMNDISYSVAVHPNPFHSCAVITIDAGLLLENFQVNIYDAVGKKIRSIALKKYSTEITGLQPGMYMLSLEGKKTKALKKLVVY